MGRSLRRSVVDALCADITPRAVREPKRSFDHLVNTRGAMVALEPERPRVNPHQHHGAGVDL
jgi:hypothetical protein